MNGLKDKVFSQLDKELGTETKHTIILGLSGGVDSMVLWDLLEEYLPRTNHKLVLAHFNHKLRKESDYEEESLKEIAKNKNAELITAYWEKPAVSNVEEEARLARYKFFTEVAISSNATCLMTAHHMDDTVETGIIRLARGSSLKGLQGIRSNENRVLKTYDATKNLKLVRPLLSVRKKELYQYASVNNITYFEDETNKENIYLRNKVRNIWIKTLEEENPKVVENLYETQKQLQASYQVNYEWYLEKEEKLIKKIGNGYVLDRTKYLKLSLAQKEVFMLMFFEERLVNILGSYSKNNLTNVKELLEQDANPNSYIDLGSNYIAKRSYDKLYFIKAEKVKENPKEQKVKLGKWYKLPQGGRLGFFKQGDIAYTNVTSYLEVYLTKEELDSFVLRTRRPGDKIELTTRSGETFTKKVSRIMIDDKVPSSLRDSMWLLAHINGQILWVIPEYSITYCKTLDEKEKYVFVYLAD